MHFWVDMDLAIFKLYSSFWFLGGSDGKDHTALGDLGYIPKFKIPWRKE